VKPALTLLEVSRSTGRSVRTIRRWISEGRLKTLPREQHEATNSPTLIAPQELERFLAVSHRMVQGGGDEAQSDESLIEEITLRVRAELLPLIQQLRQELTTTQAQLEVLHREQEMLKERQTPAPAAKSFSPWRKLLGVE